MFMIRFNKKLKMIMNLFDLFLKNKFLFLFYYMLNTMRGEKKNIKN